MSGQQLKTKAKEYVDSPGKIANFIYKLFMTVMVSLCLMAIKGGFNEGKALIIGTVNKFEKLQADRDTDRMEHVELAVRLHNQDSINTLVSDSIRQFSADSKILFSEVAWKDRGSL